MQSDYFTKVELCGGLCT